MPCLNTNNFELAKRFVNYINYRLGYRGAYMYTRTKDEFIERYGKYCAKLNLGQSYRTGIKPENGTAHFTEYEVEHLLVTEQNPDTP